MHYSAEVNTPLIQSNLKQISRAALNPTYPPTATTSTTTKQEKQKTTTKKLIARRVTSVLDRFGTAEQVHESQYDMDYNEHGCPCHEVLEGN